MSEDRKCDATTSENARNTSPNVATNRQRESGKKTKSEQNESNGTGIQEGYFSLEDLNRLTFQLTETGPILDCWHATAQEFQTYVQQFADVENVNTELWVLGERLFLINHVWEVCEKAGYPFPFTVNKILMPDAESG